MVLEYPLINGLLFIYKNIRDKKLWSYVFLSFLFLCIFIIPSIVFFITQNIFISIFFFILFIIIYFILSSWIMQKIFSRSLELAKLKPKAISFFNWLKFFIKYLLVNLFCWYDKKALLFVLFLFLCSLITYFFTKFFFIFFILLGLLFYFFILIVHSIRTVFSPFFFLLGENEPFKKSYYLVKGQTMEVYISFYVFLSFLNYIYTISIFFLFVPCLYILYFIVFILFLLFVLYSYYLLITDMFVFYSSNQKTKKSSVQSEK